MPDTKRELLDIVAQAWDVRLQPRLEGLTDEEYFWEPVPDCWTIRRRPDGTFRADWGFVFDEIPPFTTIGWRMSHLIYCYGFTASWLGRGSRENPLERDGTPGTAADALRMLAEGHDTLVANINEIDADDLSKNIGPIGGVYAERTKLSLLLHQLDEVIHHGAEVALLRDLYRAQHRNDDPFVLACLAADTDAVAAMQQQDTGVVERMRLRHPHLMLRAAETGRWDAIPLLIELGFPVDGPNGRGPVHHTAGAGKLELTRSLIDAGADLDAKDPVYGATPLGWAEYFREIDTIELLRSVALARPTRDALGTSPPR